MYDIQLSERNIVSEKSKHLALLHQVFKSSFKKSNIPECPLNFRYVTSVSK